MSVSRLPSRLKNENDLLKYLKLGDQLYAAKGILAAEKTTIDKLIEQRARSSHVKLAIQKLQDNKAILDKSLESRRNLLKPDALTTLSHAEQILTKEPYRPTGNDWRSDLYW